MTDITVTEEAQTHILSLIKDRPQDTIIRLAIEGSGCSGFKYTWGYTKEEFEGDIYVPLGQNESIVIDDMSYGMLRGSTIDYVEKDPMTKILQIINPNACNMCGCGTSFSM